MPDLTPDDMQAAAAVLLEVLPKNKGFALIAFDVVEPGNLAEYRYISNCDRTIMINALEAMLISWKMPE